MSRIFKSLSSASLVFAASLAISFPTYAQTTVTVDSTAVGDNDVGWQGFMNVFEIDRSGATPVAGGFVFGEAWGFADLTAEFAGGELTLGPNTVADVNEFWYQNTSGEALAPNFGGPGQLGNKWMDANSYVETTDTFAGQTLTFEGTVLSNSFTDNHSARVFIRDFAPDYSSNVETSFLLTTPGAFSIELALDPGTGRHVQYGFNVQGENVWSTDVAPFGSIVIEDVGAVAAVPGDYNDDQIVGFADVDLLSAQIGNASSVNPAMDLNGDMTIDLADHDQHITTLLPDANGTGALIGDLNLDGDVDVSQISVVGGQVINSGDASVLLANLGTTSGAVYAEGDLNGDGDVDVSQIVVVGGQVNNFGDASRLLANLGQNTAGAAPSASAVPEPSSLSLLALAGIASIVRRKKR